MRSFFTAGGYTAARGGFVTRNEIFNAGSGAGAPLRVSCNFSTLKTERLTRNTKLSPAVIEPIQELKINHMGNHNPRLHTDEVLIALSICAATNPMAKLALAQLPKLKDLEGHSSVILASVDSQTFKKLGVHMTNEPQTQTKKLYHR